MASIVELKSTYALVVVAALLCGCSTRSYVSATGSTPPEYTHVYLTVKELWLHPQASAQADDSGWSKFPLSAPVTVDLVSVSNGTLGKLVGGLRLSPGTYSQVRLIPVDNSVALTDSAKALSASYNNEVDYVDSGSVSHQLPLEILAPDVGIGIAGDLKVSLGGGPLPIAAGTSGTGNSTQTSSGPTILNFALNFNATSDIALFQSGSELGAILNSHAQAFDLSKCGGISGTLTLTNINNITNKSGRLNLSATAESLSSDGSRHVIVLSAPVHSDGTFLLYPLPARDSKTNFTTYDVVIHGAGIQTIIVKGVEVTRSSGSSSSASNAMTIGTANTSIGTLIPQPATAYQLNLATGTSLPAGATVSLYQTLPGSSEVPYVIEQSVIDPFNTKFQNDLVASTDAIQKGLFVTGTQSITLTSATPVQGNGSYTVAASGYKFADGSLTVIAGPPTTTASTLFSPATLSMASGQSSNTMTAFVTHSSAGSYNRGQMIISRDGTIIATTSLDAALAVATGANVPVNGLPGGSSSLSADATAIYDVTVRVWNATDPAGTLQRRSFPAAVDVRNGNAIGVQIAIN